MLLSSFSKAKTASRASISNQGRDDTGALLAGDIADPEPELKANAPPPPVAVCRSPNFAE